MRRLSAASPRAEGSLGMQLCVCKATAVGNLAPRVPPKCVWGCRAERAVCRQWDQRRWDAAGSTSQGCRVGSSRTFPLRAERRKFLVRSNAQGGCKWLLQNRQPPVPRPGGCAAASGFQPPQGWGKLPNSPSQGRPLSMAVSPEQCTPGGLQTSPRCTVRGQGKGKGEGRIWHRLGFFPASQPNISAFCLRHLAKVVPVQLAPSGVQQPRG